MIHSYKQLFLLILLVVLLQPIFAQQKVAILNTEDDGEPTVKPNELNVLTDKLRSIATKTLLPKNNYDIMNSQTMVSFLGSQEEVNKVCESADGCLAKIGRDIEADYIGQARLNRLGKLYTIKIEFYDVKKGNIIVSFTDESSKDITSLLAFIENKAPEIFKEIMSIDNPAQGTSGSLGSGIAVGQVNAGYKRNGKGTRYVVNINVEPSEADLSINGEPGLCTKMPCKLTLTEGSVPMRATYEQYETKDTVISIMQNNQDITIRLKPNFGTLVIRPAFSDGVGSLLPWNLILNNKNYSLSGSKVFETRLMPNKYMGKLTHNCYEDIPFDDIGIERDKSETFDMSKYVKLKSGGLDLEAERNGEPVVEPVFVNGRQVGETPFSGTVPLCSDIRIGNDREMVSVKLIHNELVEYTAKLASKKPAPTPATTPFVAPAARPATYTGYSTEPESGWNGDRLAGIGGLMLLNTVDSLYNSGGFGLFIDIEFYNADSDFFHTGGYFDISLFSPNEEAIKKIRPDADSIVSSFLFNVGAFAKLYPVDFLYLRVGAGINYSSYEFDTAIGDKIKSNILAPVFPVGGGLTLGAFYIEGLYNIMPSRSAGYLSIILGFKIPEK